MLLGNSGKPINPILFNVHKLIALASVVYAAIFIFNLAKAAEMKTLILVLIIASILLVIALFASGAMISMGTPIYNILRSIHISSTVLIIITLVLTLYNLIIRKV